MIAGRGESIHKACSEYFSGICRQITTGNGRIRSFKIYSKVRGRWTVLFNNCLINIFSFDRGQVPQVLHSAHGGFPSGWGECRAARRTGGWTETSSGTGCPGCPWGRAGVVPWVWHLPEGQCCGHSPRESSTHPSTHPAPPLQTWSLSRRGNYKIQECSLQSHTGWSLTNK